jgi:protein-disulfide isomerase
MRPFTTKPLLLLALASASVLAASCADGRAAAGKAPPEMPAKGVDTAPDDGQVDLRSVGYDLGSADAPVVVVEFSDFGCSFCAMFARGTFPELHEEFVETGKVRWKYVPFVMGMFPNGDEAARAAECAGEQDKFWEMHDLLYAHQGEWRRGRDAAGFFASLAAQAELDRGKFASCYREDRRADRTRAANQAARAGGIRATPTFLIDGRRVEGALPAETFRQLLSAAVAGAERR